jgi:hypothetical protein
MAERKGYNGHPSYNYWNVALWVANDEGLYRLALDCIRQTSTRRAAAMLMLETLTDTYLAEFGSKPTHFHLTPTTPDGAPYTVASLVHAMRGLEG